MAQNPTVVDKLLAKVLSSEIPLVVVLLAVAIAGVWLSLRVTADQYLQSAGVEIAVGSFFFLAIYIFTPDQLTVSLVLALLFCGYLAAHLGWYVSLTRPLLSAYLLEAASALTVFVVVEQIVRHLLIKARQREARLAAAVQKQRVAAQRALKEAAQRAAEARRAATEHAIDATAAAVTVVLSWTGDNISVAYEDEGGGRFPLEGISFPEPPFDLSDETLAWSVPGIFRWNPPPAETEDGSTKTR